MGIVLNYLPVDLFLDQLRKSAGDTYGSPYIGLGHSMVGCYPSQT